MSWIKMRSNLDSDPDVIALASALSLTELDIIGRLWKLWSWADQHSFSGNAVRVTDVTLDRFTMCTGFAEALRQVGWLDGESGCVTFPNFERHNGQTAKTRGLTANRVAKKRNAECVTREEKRRVDKSSTKEDSKKKSGSLSEVEDYCEEIGLDRSDGTGCFHKWDGNGWTNGGKPIRDWRATLRSWKAYGYLPSQKQQQNGSQPQAAEPHPKGENVW